MEGFERPDARDGNSSSRVSRNKKAGLLHQLVLRVVFW